jgi:hypothetical protein
LFACRPGLYPASLGGEISSGYGNIWIRDNIYIAYAYHLRGASNVATDVVRALIAYGQRFLTTHSPDDRTILPPANYSVDPVRVSSLSSVTGNSLIRLPVVRHTSVAIITDTSEFQQ